MSLVATSAPLALPTLGTLGTLPLDSALQVSIVTVSKATPMELVTEHQDPTVAIQVETLALQATHQAQQSHPQPLVTLHHTSHRHMELVEPLDKQDKQELASQDQPHPVLFFQDQEQTLAVLVVLPMELESVQPLQDILMELPQEMLERLEEHHTEPVAPVTGRLKDRGME